MSSCGLLFVFVSLYSSAAVFMIVGGQSTTDDDQEDVSILEQLITMRANQAMLQAKVEMLETRLSSVTLDNRKLFSIKFCFAVCSGICNYWLDLSSSRVVL